MSIYLQYQSSPNIVNYVESLQNNIRVSASQFYYDFYNIDTCGSAGLDMWGIILNRPRSVLVPNELFQNVLGFENSIPPANAGDYPQNFYYSNFAYTGDVTMSLTDIEYRALLKFTYLNYVSDGSLKTINRTMNYYYNPDGTNGKEVTCTYTAPMQLTYDFNFALQSYEIILFNQDSVLPTPICVEQILVYPT